MVFGRLLKRGNSRAQVDEEMRGLDQLESGECETSGLLSTGSFVHALDKSKNTVCAERVSPNMQLNLGIEGFAFKPCEVNIHVPEGHQAGTALSVQGPIGMMKLLLPAEAVPGTNFRYRLKAAPEYRVQVPPDASPGSAVTFERADGARISFAVPQGSRPGDQFEVSPPALMLLVPEGLHPGDYVLFNTASVPGFTMADEQGELFRAQIPEELQLGKYFAASLPGPKSPTEKLSKGLRFFRGAFGGE